jgi:DNA invertase Pin-like site-specific DNA recombinase
MRHKRQCPKKAGFKKIFFDVASEAIAQRPGLGQCLDYLRSEDTLVVWKSERLGRSTVDLLQIIDKLRVREIGFKSKHNSSEVCSITTL